MIYIFRKSPFYRRSTLLIITFLFISFHIAVAGAVPEKLATAFFRTYDMNDYASSQNRDISITPKGTLIIANNTGLMTYDGNNWNLYRLPDKSEIAHVVYHNDTIFTKGENHTGYWIKNELGLLTYIPLEKSPSHIQFKHYPDTIPYLLPESILLAQPSAFASLNGFNYTGTLTNGLYVTDQEGNIIVHETEKSQLNDNIIYAISTDLPGQIWIACDNGLTAVTLDAAIRFFGRRNHLGQLSEALLFQDDLYIHTNKGYFKRPVEVGHSFESVPEKEALPLFSSRPDPVVNLPVNTIFNNSAELDIFAEADYIYRVSDELYWLVHENQAGLFSLQEGTEQLKCRILFDNYKLNLISRGKQIMPLNDSLHIFSTIQGIVMVNTHKLIRKGISQGIPHRFSAISYIHEDQVKFLPPETAKISLPHNFQKLNVYVASTILTPNNQISYQIGNMSSEWSDWQKSGHISLLQLPEGKYELKVRKYVPTGEFPEISLLIEVLPPWYNTIWAYVIYVILIWGITQASVSFYFSVRRREEKRGEEIKRQEELKKLQELKNEILQTELQNKNNELMLRTSVLARKSQLIHTLMEEVDAQKETLGDRYPNRLYNRLKNILQKILDDQSDWDAFENYFNSAHQNFIERLRQSYPDITTGDIRMCCLLRMNLSTKEIASILNVSIRAVELRRYRMRKRMNLNGDTNLITFLMNF